MTDDERAQHQIESEAFYAELRDKAMRSIMRPEMKDKPVTKYRKHFDTIKRMVEEGARIREIVEAIGGDFSEGSLRFYLRGEDFCPEWHKKYMNPSYRSKVRRDQLKSKILELRDKGYSHEMIGRQLGYAPTTICKYLHQYAEEDSGLNVCQTDNCPHVIDAGRTLCNYHEALKIIKDH